MSRPRSTIYVRALRDGEPSMQPCDVQELRDWGFMYIRIKQDESIWRESDPMIFKEREVIKSSKIQIIHEKSQALPTGWCLECNAKAMLSCAHH